MLRKFFIAAVLVALVASAAASAGTRSHRRAEQQSVTTAQLMPGVTYTREVDFTSRGPVVLDVVTAPKPDGTLYSLAPALSNEALGATEPLTQLQQRVSGGATSVAIDGDYFNSKSGAPSGILMEHGVLESGPSSSRSSLGIAADGTLHVAQVSFGGSWEGSGQRRPLQLNTTAGHFTLYTPDYGPATPQASNALEAVLQPFPAASLGQALDGVVTQVTSSGSTPIPRQGAVLVAHGATYVKQLQAEAPVGQQIAVQLSLDPDWGSFVGAIGGGPLLVRNGKPVFHAGESFDPRPLDTREARGAVGQLADGRIVLVTVEGTNPAYSIGMTSYELAIELEQLGAVTAVGLGTGPAAGLAFDGTLLTRPDGGGQARVSDALVLSYSGVYAEPPSAAVLSPNGDGVDDTETLAYHLPRPASVVAKLTGPGGTTIQLADDSEAPGLHTLTWDGLDGTVAAPEGSWTFTVTATDDRRVTTTAQRTFSLDDTLAALAVAPGSGGYPTATFQLTRTAGVVVRIDRPNGVPVATLQTASLQAGAYRVTWKGKAGGRRAPGGRYQFEVQATSTVGKSSLLAPFSWAPHASQ